jgi:glycosyltransferase involved in cell wall biosynthesis
MSSVFFDYSTMAQHNGHPTGIPRTVEELARAFDVVAPETRFIALTENGRGFRHYDRNSRKFGGEVVFSQGDKLFSASAGWAFSHFNREVATLVAKGVKYSHLHYDLIPSLFPYFYKDTGFGDYFRNWTTESLTLCSNAFSISRCTREDIIKHCLGGQHTLPFHVIRLGDAVPTEATAAIGLSPEIAALDRFVISVGTLEYRKNQITLLNAYRVLISRGFAPMLPTLVLVGREGWLNNWLTYQASVDPLLKNKVVVLTNVTDAELDYLYRNCLFTLFPALYEGWGLPVAESLNYGKPCISSSTSSMPEIAPAFTRFADPLNLSQWVAHISELSGDGPQLRDESTRIREGYKPASWTNTALMILNHIQ